MPPESRIDELQRKLSPLRATILDHPIYRQIDSIDKLHLFMQHHVFAVWDFMSILKSLQQRLCGNRLPWVPPTNRTASRLINEIVLSEESDEDGNGSFASHFDLYHRAMRRCGANTQTVDHFLDLLRQDDSIASALSKCNAPPCVERFVRQTFETIEFGDLCGVASAFAIGREDLLPDLFQRVVDELSITANEDLHDFRYYLVRHIEMDGDHHGPMAYQLVAELCGDDDSKWRAAEEAAIRSLQARKALWDDIAQMIGSDPKSSLVAT